MTKLPQIKLNREQKQMLTCVHVEHGIIYHYCQQLMCAELLPGSSAQLIGTTPTSDDTPMCAPPPLLTMATPTILGYARHCSSNSVLEGRSNHIEAKFSRALHCLSWHRNFQLTHHDLAKNFSDLLGCNLNTVICRMY